MGDAPFPSDRTIQRQALALRKKLFDGRIKYRAKEIVYLLNILSNYDAAPNLLNIPWGDAIITIESMKNCMESIGTRGSLEELNAKRVVIAAATAPDTDGGSPQNAKLLRSLLPHRCDKTKKAFINRCVARRERFDADGNSKAFCHDIVRLPRES